MELSPNLLRVLTCPATGGKLTYDKFSNELISESAGLVYPIINDIPILLIDKARKINPLNHKLSPIEKESNKIKKVAKRA